MLKPTGRTQRQRKRFQLKVTLLLIVCMLSVLLLSHVLIYQFTLRAQFEALRQRLMMLAQTAALTVDAAKLLQIPLIPLGIYTQPYQDIVSILKEIKEANPPMRYLYTMVKTDKEGIWQFVVDADTLPEKVTESDFQPRPRDKPALSFPGDLYDASRFPEMLKAFDGPQADRQLGEDEWGVLLSGYAPIRNTQGQAVAMLGVDIMAEDIALIRREFTKRIGIVLLIGLLISLGLGMIASRPISAPIENLVSGIRRMARGNLQYRVAVPGKDEISELAQRFNEMASQLFKSRRKIFSYFRNSVLSLARVLEVRDQYTKGHSESVARYAGEIALRMGYSRQQVKLFKKLTVLHDIGKIGIRDDILNKPGPLTPEERELMKRHPLIGEEILKPVLGKEPLLAVVRSHHERYDGKGYPDQLKGEAINIFAAIVSVADAYHAMISNRPYRKALPQEDAIAELKRHRGTQFHPQIVDVFLKILEEEATASKS